jgi:hypothetical protein
MKRLLFSTVFAMASATALAASVAHADDAAADFGSLPARLRCSAPNARVPELKTFELSKLNTEEPESTFEDGVQSATLKDGILEVSFSDECESWFAVTFAASELEALKAGKISSVPAKFDYEELPEKFPDLPVDHAENEQDHTTATCTLAK